MLKDMKKEELETLSYSLYAYKRRKEYGYSGFI